LNERTGGPRYPAWLALPAVGWYAAFFLAPLGILALFSVSERVGYSEVAYHFNLQNFSDLIDPLYGKVFLRTLQLAAIGTLLTLLVGFPLAYYLARYARRKTLLLILVIVPFWTSFLIRTYSWLIILDPDFWLLRALRAIGVTDGGTILYTREAIYLGVLYNYLPLMILPLYAALERMDWSLVEAATDLGATPFNAFRQITLRLTLPGAVTGALLVFIPMSGEYIIPNILSGGNYEFVGNVIGDQFASAQNQPFGSALSISLMIALSGFVALYILFATKEERFGP